MWGQKFTYTVSNKTEIINRSYDTLAGELVLKRLTPTDVEALEPSTVKKELWRFMLKDIRYGGVKLENDDFKIWSQPSSEIPTPKPPKPIASNDGAGGKKIYAPEGYTGAPTETSIKRMPTNQLWDHFDAITTEASNMIKDRPILGQPKNLREHFFSLKDQAHLIVEELKLRGHGDLQFRNNTDRGARDILDELDKKAEGLRIGSGKSPTSPAAETPDPTKQAIPTAGGIDGSGASGATSVPPVSPPNSGATSVPPVSPPNSGAKTPSIKEVLAAAGRVAPLVAKIEPHVQVGSQAVTAAFEIGEKVHKGDEVGNSLKSVDKFTIYTLKLEAQRADWAEAANANPNNAELRADLAKLDQEIAWHEKLLPTVRVWQQSVKPAHDAEGLTPSPEAQKLRDDSTTLYVYLRNETVNKWQELELITKRIPGKGSELDFATAAQKQAEAAMGVIMNGDADTTEGEAQKFRAKALDEIMHKQLAKDKDAADIARNLFIKSKSKPHEKNKLKENALAAAQQEENTARWLLKRNPDDVQAQDGALHAGDVNHSLTGTPRWQNRQDERRQVQTPAPVPDWVAGHVRNDRYDFKTTTPTWAAEGDGRDGRGRDGRGRDGRGRDADTTTPIGTDAGATPRAGTGAANPGDNSWLRNQNVAKQINDLNEQMLSLDRGQPVEVNPGMHQPPATPVPTAASRVRTPQHPPAKRNVEALSVGTVFIRALPVSGTRFDCIQVPESGVGSPTPGTSKYSDSNCQIPIKR